MQNEKQAPASQRNPKRVHASWYHSLIFLIFPSFQSDWRADPGLKTSDLILSSTVLPFAHAHNDYRHNRPLREALSRGFSSVEADVHLVGEELYLGHWLPQIGTIWTLKTAYLDPLNDLMMRQGGKVYAGYEGVFYLMIDVKTDSSDTYRSLRRLLLQYPAFQCNPYFQVFVSGNRAIQNILNDTERVMAVDGRLTDLNKLIPTEAMPVVSDNFRKHFKWRGKGPIPVRELEQLKTIALQVHLQGKKLRFWNIPDQPNAWETLMQAGVDFINTDDLQGLEQFFMSRKRDDRTDSCRVVACGRADDNHFLPR